MVRVNELQERPTAQTDVHIGGAREQAARELSSPQQLTVRDNSLVIKNGALDMSADIYQANPLAKSGGAEKVGSCTIGVPDCAQRQQFKPDYTNGSRGSREWQRDSQNQRNKPLETDDNGDYKVQRGDSLWTIGERMARGEDGKKPSAKTVQKAIEDLVKANPELKCNPDYLKHTDKLHIPGHEKLNDVTRMPDEETVEGPSGIYSETTKPEEHSLPGAGNSEQIEGDGSVVTRERGGESTSVSPDEKTITIGPRESYGVFPSIGDGGGFGNGPETSVPGGAGGDVQLGVMGKEKVGGACYEVKAVEMPEYIINDSLAKPVPMPELKQSDLPGLKSDMPVLTPDPLCLTPEQAQFWIGKP